MISVIIPIYNVERYLDDCIQSIVAQTYKDWQLILVDDGSTDASSAIAQQWQHGDNRIKYFRISNCGVSAARNFGVDNASGDYLMFVDSDDVCHPRLLEYLCSCVDSDSEIIMCRSLRFENKPVAIAHEGFIPAILQGLDELYNSMVFNQILHAPIAKLYRRDIIEKHDVRFPVELKLGEDVLFNLNYLKHISSGVLVDLPLYFYRNTPCSLSKKIQNDYADIQLRILSEKLKFISSHGICFDYTPYAPSIVRDIALTIFRSTASDAEKIECIDKLRQHPILNYCSIKGKFADILISQAIKRLPSRIVLRLLK